MLSASKEKLVQRRCNRKVRATFILSLGTRPLRKKFKSGPGYAAISTPFTRYWIQMNTICYRSVLPFHLHDDDDESDMKSTRTWIRYRIDTASCRSMSSIWFHTWPTMRSFLLLKKLGPLQINLTNAPQVALSDFAHFLALSYKRRETKAPSTLVRITCWSVPQVVRIGLPSTLLLANRTKTGAVRRTTFGPFRKRTISDPDYLQVAFFRPGLHW